MLRRTGSAILAPATLVLLMILSGCATYHALPLPKHPNLSHGPDASANTEGHGGIPRALNLQVVGQLAMRRDPALAVARAQTRVAKAHAYAAGLLPDPSLSLALQHPFHGGASSDHNNAWSAGLTESLISLITHSDRHSAASARFAESMLSWRWQAEQVALKARVDFLNVWAARRTVTALKLEAEQARQVLAAAQRAHLAGALQSALYQQAQRQAATVRTRLQKARDREVQLEGSLDTTLRVSASHRWRFSEPPLASMPAAQAINSAIKKLPARRLDLLALQAGYRSANRQLRADILAQFPILDIGFTHSRDNTGVHMWGFGVTIRLPFFDGNRGRIAIARANRKALNVAYQSHLDRAANKIQAVYKRLRVAVAEYRSLKRQLPSLAKSAHASEVALTKGDVTRFQAFGTLTAWLDARIDADRLRASGDQLALTLQTLLSIPPRTHSHVRNFSI